MNWPYEIILNPLWVHDELSKELKGKTVRNFVTNHEQVILRKDLEKWTGKRPDLKTISNNIDPFIDFCLRCKILHPVRSSFTSRFPGMSGGMYNLESESPRQVFYFRIVGARDLLATNRTGTADTYAKVRYMYFENGKHNNHAMKFIEAKTHMVSDQLHPQWNQTFVLISGSEFQNVRNDNDSLSVHIYSSKSSIPIKHDPVLGSTHEIQLKDISFASQDIFPVSEIDAKEYELGKSNICPNMPIGKMMLTGENKNKENCWRKIKGVVTFGFITFDIGIGKRMGSLTSSPTKAKRKEKHGSGEKRRKEASKTESNIHLEISEHETPDICFERSKTMWTEEQINIHVDKIKRFITSFGYTPRTSMWAPSRAYESHCALDYIKFIQNNLQAVFDLIAGKSPGANVRICPRFEFSVFSTYFFPLCHVLNSHVLYSSLCMKQQGGVDKALSRIGQQNVPVLGFPVFEHHIKALKQCYKANASLLSQTQNHFSELELGSGEILLREDENVSFVLRKAKFTNLTKRLTFRGRLLYTTDSIYFCKRRMFHRNEFWAKKICTARHVFESNGKMTKGIMVGFSDNDIEEDLPASFTETDTDEEYSFKETQNSFKVLNGNDSFEEHIANMLQHTASSASIDSAGIGDDTNEYTSSKNSQSSANERIKYAVFRFMKSENRNTSMFILRFMIVWQEFQEEFLHGIGSSQIIRLIHTIEPSKVIELGSFLDMVKAHMARMFQEEILTFTALGVDAYFEIDYYFNPDEDWCWRHWCCLSIMNYYYVQRSGDLDNKLKTVSWTILTTYSICSLLEVAAENHISIIWRHCSRFGSEVSETDTMAYPRQEAILEASRCKNCLERTHLVSKYCGQFYALGSKYLFDELVQKSYQLDSIGQNKDLLMDIIAPIVEAADIVSQYYQDILNWKSPTRTILLGSFSLIMILLRWTQYLPGLSIFFVCWIFYCQKNAATPKLYVPVKTNVSLYHKMKSFKQKYAYVKMKSQIICFNTLKARGLLTWTNPQASRLFMFVLLAFGALVLCTPLVFYELFIWIYIFTKKFRSGRLSKKIKKYVRSWWRTVPPSFLYDHPKQKEKLT